MTVAIYLASKTGIAKLRDTKLCVNEVSSTMNGILISSLRSVE